MEGLLRTLVSVAFICYGYTVLTQLPIHELSLNDPSLYVLQSAKHYRRVKKANASVSTMFNFCLKTIHIKHAFSLTKHSPKKY